MRQQLRIRTVTTAGVACLVAIPALAGCGSDDGAEDGDRISVTPADEGDHSHDGSEGDGHSHGDMGDMEGMTGDPDATPANELSDAELVQGSFALLPDAPAGSPEVSGSAWLARTDDGTTLSIDVSGLEAGADYMSHLHAEACEPNSGGDHFKFDPQGSDQPPNEVHLAVTADDAGRAATTITNENAASEGARSMVLHLPDGTKFACVDFVS